MQKFLVVDDEPRIRTVLRGYREAGRYHVAEAADGSEVLAAPRKGPPAVVLLDLRLRRSLRSRVPERAWMVWRPREDSF